MPSCFPFLLTNVHHLSTSSPPNSIAVSEVFRSCDNPYCLPFFGKECWQTREEFTRCTKCFACFALLFLTAEAVPVTVCCSFLDMPISPVKRDEMRRFHIIAIVSLGVIAALLNAQAVCGGCSIEFKIILIQNLLNYRWCPHFQKGHHDIIPMIVNCGCVWIIF